MNPIAVLPSILAEYGDPPFVPFKVTPVWEHAQKDEKKVKCIITDASKWKEEPVPETYDTCLAIRFQSDEFRKFSSRDQFLRSAIYMKPYLIWTKEEDGTFKAVLEMKNRNIRRINYTFFINVSNPKKIEVEEFLGVIQQGKTRRVIVRSKPGFVFSEIKGNNLIIQLAPIQFDKTPLDGFAAISKKDVLLSLKNFWLMHGTPDFPESIARHVDNFAAANLSYYYDPVPKQEIKQESWIAKKTRILKFKMLGSSVESYDPYPQLEFQPMDRYLRLKMRDPWYGPIVNSPPNASPYFQMGQILGTLAPIFFGAWLVYFICKKGALFQKNPLSFLAYLDPRKWNWKDWNPTTKKVLEINSK